jgi:hypothetical protein
MVADGRLDAIKNTARLARIVRFSEQINNVSLCFHNSGISGIEQFHKANELSVRNSEQAAPDRQPARPFWYYFKTKLP